MPDNKLKTLHKGLQEEGMTDKNFEEFSSEYSNPEKQVFLHKGLQEEGMTDKNFEEFSSEYFSKLVDPKGGKAESQDGDFQFLSASTNSSSESNPNTPTSPAVELQDATIDLYEQYKEVVGGTVTIDQEGDIDSLVGRLYSNRDRSRTISQKKRSELRDTSLEDYKELDNVKAIVKQKREEYRVKNRREFLAKLPNEDQVKLLSHIESLYSGAKEETKEIAAESEIQKNYLSTTKKATEELLKKGEYTEEDIEFLKETSQKFMTVANEYNDNVDDLNNSEDVFGSFQEQLSHLKRTTSTTVDIIYKTAGSIAGALDSITEFVGEFPLAGVPSISNAEASPKLFESIQDPLKSVVKFAEDYGQESVALGSIESPADFLAWGKDVLTSQAGNILLTMSGSPELAFVATSAAAGGDKIKELKASDKNYTKADLQKAALFSAVVGGFESIVDRGILKRAKGALKNAKKTATSNKKVLGKEVLKDIGVDISVGQISNSLNNIFDKYVLGDDVHILDGWKENLAADLFMQGTIQGASKGLPVAIYETTKAVRKVADKKKYNTNNKRIKSIFEQMQNLDDSDPLKAKLQGKIKEILGENENIIDNDIQSLNKLTKEDAKELTKIDKELKKAFEEKKSIEDSEALEGSVAEELATEVQQKIVDLSKKREALLDANGFNKAIRAKAKQNIIERKKEKLKEKGLDPESYEVTEPEIVKEYNNLFEDLEVESKSQFIKAYKVSKDFAREFARREGTTLEGSVKEASLKLEETEYYKTLKSDEARKNIKRNFEFEVRKTLLEEDYFKPEGIAIKDRIIKGKSKVKDFVATKFIDSYYKLEKQVYKNYGYEDAKDAIAKLRLYNKKAAQGIENFDTDRVTPILKEIKESDYDFSEVEQYMKAVHSLEASSYINTKNEDKKHIGAGMSIERAGAILDKYKDNKNILNLATKLQDITNDTRKILLEGGLISEKRAEELTSFYDFYVPLSGFDSSSGVEIADFTPSAKLNVSNLAPKKREGRTIESENAIANIFTAYQKAVMNAEKNKVLSSIASLKDLGEGNGQLFEIVDGTLPIEQGNDRDSYVSFFDKGVKKHIIFKDKSINKALNKADVLRASQFFKVLTPVKNWFTSVLTTYNPDFVLSNFVRDGQTAITSIFSDIEADPSFKGVSSTKVAKDMMGYMASGLGDVYKGVRNNQFDTSTKEGRYAKEFFEEGGYTRFANLYNVDQVVKRLNLDQLASQDTKGKKPLEKFKINKAKATSWIRSKKNFAENINGTVENIYRYSSYSALRDQGVSKQDAAKFAAEMTIDFNQSGEWGSAASATYFFFNASVQGSRRFWKTLYNKKLNTETGKKDFTTAQKMMASFVGISFANTFAHLTTGEQDEDGKTFYEKQPDYIKNTHMRFGTGKRTVDIPVQYGFNVLSTLGNTMAEVALGRKDMAQGITDVAMVTLDSFLPVSVSNIGADKPLEKLADTAVPSVVQPLYDIAINKNFFNAPIYSEYDTSEDQLEDQVGYLIEVLLGGIGKTVANTKGFVDSVQEGDPNYEKLTIVRRFQSEYNPFYDISEFKNSFKEIQEKRKKVIKENKGKPVSQLSKKDKKVLELYNKANGYNKKINSLYKAKQKLADADKKTAAKKDKEIKKLIKEAALKGIQIIDKNK